MTGVFEQIFGNVKPTKEELPMRDSQTEIITDWSAYAPYFNPKVDTRLACRTTGNLAMRKGFMDRMLKLRKMCDFPFIVTSAYRDPTHPEEARKNKPGAHALGVAMDIHVITERAWKVIEIANQLGFTACGVSQKGDFSGRFIHLDSARSEDGLPRPTTGDNNTKVFYTY